MSVENERIAEVVNAFKKYVKKVVIHSAIDYARCVKKNSIKEVSYNDVVVQKMSLSIYDDGIFFINKEFNFESIDNPNLILGISKLTGLEKNILKLEIKGFPNTEIAKILNTTEKTVRNLKSRAKKKLIRFL